MGVPVLGICYGQQLMCAELGGAVEQSGHQEFGRAIVDVQAPCALFDGTWMQGGREQVWMSHGDRVTLLPPGFRTVASSEGAPFAVVADEQRRFYGVQFHPEVVHTPHGAALLRNFTHGVAGLRGDWTMAEFRSAAIDRIRAQVGQGRVICGLSGGVDSSVAAVLIHEAIGDQLTCIFVDHGLLRRGEAEQVVSTFRDRFNIQLVHRDASDLFLDALAGVSRPGGQAQDHRPPVHRGVRAGGRPHRRRRLPRPGHAVPGRDRERQRHRRPQRHHQEPPQRRRPAGADADAAGRAAARAVQGRGPRAWAANWACRTPGRPPPVPRPRPGDPHARRASPAKAWRSLRHVDAIFLEEIRAAGLYDTIWQAFAVLLPVRTVGVMGDGRTYDQACALRAVTSTDGMTAEFYPFDMAFLGRVAGRIVGEVRGVNRVTYDITSKPPGTIEWE